MKVIAELGINHRGSADIAGQLIDIAAKAGAWGAKFQYRAKEGFYQATDEIGDEILSHEIDESYIPPEDILKLARDIQGRGMAAGVSFFKFSDASDFGGQIDVFDFFKVPSAELMNRDLVQAMAGLGKPLILSTGGHSEADIDRVLADTAHIPHIIYLHCISNYPVLLGNQQMAFIRSLKQKTGAEVGYSSHDQDWEVCLVAAANGATVFERHLTLDKHGKGIDDSSSSDPDEFIRLCRLLNAHDAIQGDGKREINQGERINMQNLGSSLYASRDIAAGEDLSSANTVLKAPRKGLTWAGIEERGLKALMRPVPAGTAITELHFTTAKPPLEAGLVDFCDAHELSLPIRLHDAALLQTRFPILNYELHLSYQEVEAFGRSMADGLAGLDMSRQYSIHIPDYINSKTLIDPLSSDPHTVEGSRRIVTTCVDLALELEHRTGASVPIVGSFSRLIPDGKRATYEKLQETLEAAGRARGIPIYPQWLPRIAWYFGGADVLDMFCGDDDIDIVTDIGMELCLDLSHLILSANYAKAEWRGWCERLMPLARHIHIADATGIDGEGIEFGQGDLGDPAKYIQGPERKVLEVWQGHLSEGDGFEKAIRQLGGSHG